jgi:hypothetical protein
MNAINIICSLGLPLYDNADAQRKHLQNRAVNSSRQQASQPQAVQSIQPSQPQTVQFSQPASLRPQTTPALLLPPARLSQASIFPHIHPQQPHQPQEALASELTKSSDEARHRALCQQVEDAAQQHRRVDKYSLTKYTSWAIRNGRGKPDLDADIRTHGPPHQPVFRLELAVPGLSVPIGGSGAKKKVEPRVLHTWQILSRTFSLVES